MHTDVSSRIRRLPPSVINKIAAGEVIERPASIVKELLENSVDALATRIDVEIEQGGADLVRIVDNGEGIHPDDVLLAVTSHATSKLASADDLFHISTLGFRGEALASIAEISQFRMRTRQREQPGGTELIVDGGTVKEHRLCGCPEGTQIEVRQLFFNTPVRRKFLKTSATEFAHVSEQFTRIALAHPALHMTLRHYERLIHELPATSNLLERLELFFGGELADQLIPVEAEHSGVRIWGYVAHPSQSKASRKGQYLFLNGRWIQDRSLQHALGEAYRGLVMTGRYPIAFLFLELPPEEVDVNVHPTKAEVRFQDSQTLYRLLLSTLRNKFLSADLDSRLSLQRPASEAAEAEPFSDPTPPASWARQALDQQRQIFSRSAFESPVSLKPLSPSSPAAPPMPEFASPVSAETPDPFASASPAATPASEAPTGQPAPTASSGRSSGNVRAMQVHDCYLLVETEEGITVIDQHALHERIMYEHLRQRILSGGVEVQRLLIPLTVALTNKEAAILLDQQQMLEELGLAIQDFGGGDVALSGYPVMLAKADPQTLLKDIVDLLESSGRQVERRDLIDKMLHMMSCKAAIKSGQRLSIEEIDALLSQRHLCDDAHHCPHGRPTALQLSREELDRQFGRLG